MIEITLVQGHRQIDLLVPRAVRFGRLRQLILEAFAAKGTALPDDFSFALDDKALAVSGYDYISSFGIGNGDRLQIVT
ncbi:EsaB/YukD family protein [Leifsonia shinshuensis]|uniref:Putative ubiquitin-like protein YukD n=1 Tax=Leifsonia shinshuensis TaxID=150026 RepID=A0A853CQJ7_9MICO|nr:EsaB/YukD family protein [Leifsonia shinshuensis]NYJ23196.1 putative ubiquitin-like protein YukD [Leifsonia shinshuensis]